MVQAAVQANEKYGGKAQKTAVKNIAKEAANFDEKIITHIVGVISDSIAKCDQAVDPSGREDKRYADTRQIVRETLNRMLELVKKIKYASRDRSTDRTDELRANQEQLDRSVNYLIVLRADLEG